jgi:hypothetical protein
MAKDESEEILKNVKVTFKAKLTNSITKKQKDSTIHWVFHHKFKQVDNLFQGYLYEFT